MELFYKNITHPVNKKKSIARQVKWLPEQKPTTEEEQPTSSESFSGYLNFPGKQKLILSKLFSHYYYEYYIAK